MTLLGALPAFAAAPYVHTQAAAPISTTNATLNGMVVPNGLPTVAWFEWGTNGSYGQQTISTNVGSGQGVVYLSLPVSYIPRSSPWHYRLAASNAFGIAYGAERLFRTGRRIATWGARLDSGTNSPPQLGDIASIASGISELVLKPGGAVSAFTMYFSNQVSVPSGLTNIVGVAGDGVGNVALRANGSVTLWGNNTQGQTNIPMGLSNVVSLAAGNSHMLALQADGRVVAWGDNYAGKTNAPSGLSNVVAIAAGLDHSVAVRADGTVASWGDNSYGQTNVPVGLSNVTAVAAGWGHSVALMADGNLVAWGWDYWGVTNPPVEATNVVEVVCDFHNNLALRADGTVVPWGSRLYYSSYGNYVYSGSADVPTGLTNVVTLAAGRDHSLALVGNRRPRADPQSVAGAANQDLALALSGTDTDEDELSFRVTALPPTGSLYQYNAGGRGDLIAVPETLVTDPSHRIVFAPEPDAFGEPYATLAYACSDGELDSAMATVEIRIVGRPFCHTQPATITTGAAAILNGMVVANGFPTIAWFEWGTNRNYGQKSGPFSAGQSGSVVRLTAPVGNLSPGAVVFYQLVASNQVAVAYGSQHRFTTGQRVTSWGPNTYGQLPVPAGLTNAIAVDGFNHRLVLTAEGTLSAWGQNNFGQIAVPANPSNAVAIACGGEHNLALRGDGTVAAWGRYDAGQTTVPTGLSNVIAVAAGNNHSLALRTDGRVVAWGYGDYGQTNVPPGLSNVVAIAGGFLNSLALKADGTVQAWGYQAGTLVPADLTNVVAIKGLLALNADGTVTKLGSGANPPAGLSNVVAITDFSALRSDGTVVSWSAYPPPLALSNVVALSSTIAVGPNQPPVALLQSVSGIANQDLALTLQGTDWNGDTVTYRVASLPAVGSLYQFNAGSRGPLISTPGAAVTDSGGRVIFAPAPNGFGNSYATFDFIATDGELDSTPATVNVRIVGEPHATTFSVAPGGQAGAVLRGMVAPNGFASSAWFEWATNGGFTQTSLPQSVGSGPTPVYVTAGITNLSPTGFYRCRLVVSNEVGSVHGGDQLFTTRGTVVAWGRGVDQIALIPPPVLERAVAVEAGDSHGVALNRDGKVVAFPLDALGQSSAITNVPASASNVVAVAAGGSHSLALKADGKVLAWGKNTSNQTNVPANLSNVVSLAAGSSYSIALKGDGSLASWGSASPNYSQATVPAGLSNILAVAAGDNHNLALRSDGTVAAWGNNSSGQTHVPAALSNVMAIAAGIDHSLALRRDGTVVSWGYNHGGQTNVPAALSNVVALAGGGTHSLALRSDGTIVSWGSGSGVSVPTNLIATVIAAGSSFGLAIQPALNVLPYAATQPATEVAASSAVLHGMASPREEPASAWFEWVTGGILNQTTPLTEVGAADGVVRVDQPINGLSPGDICFYRLVVSNRFGVVYGATQRFSTSARISRWGNTNYPLPAGLSNVVTVASGGSHSIVLKAGGGVIAWGSTTNLPANLSNVVAVAAGESHNLVLRSDGTVAAAGSNSDGQTSVPASLSNVVVIATGRSHNLALKSDGTVVSWGRNVEGQRNVPAGLKDVVAIAGGFSHSLALRNDGKVVAWGDNAYGQTNIPASVSNVIAIAAGLHSVALRADGTLVTWGTNSISPTNVPTGLSNVVAIATSRFHSVALREDGSVVSGGNLPPVAQAQVVSGFPNHDLVITLSGSVTNQDPLAFRVNTLPVIGSLFQHHLGARGAPILSPIESITDPNGRIIFAPAANTLGSPQANFTFTASDGALDSPPATVTVNVVLPPLPQLNAAESGVAKVPPPRLWSAGANVPGSGNYSLRFAGYSNLTYSVWASTNLVHWLPVGTASPTTNGWLQFVDVDSTNWPRRFYRISIPNTRAYELNFGGHSNATYRVWASTNLVDWDVLGVATVTSNGWFNFLDVEAAKWPQRFYRAGAP